MWFLNMHDLLNHLSQLSSYIPAIIVTVAVALLVGCAVGCNCSPCEEKDEIFRRKLS